MFIRCNIPLFALFLGNLYLIFVNANFHVKVVMMVEDRISSLELSLEQEQDTVSLLQTELAQTRQRMQVTGSGQTNSVNFVEIGRIQQQPCFMF